jgi:hypothetical protein
MSHRQTHRHIPYITRSHRNIATSRHREMDGMTDGSVFAIATEDCPSDEVSAV